MKKIPLTQGKYALVDDGDFDWLSQWKWCYGGKGYAVRFKAFPKKGGGYKFKSIIMHRLINNTPDGLNTDHVDGNQLNNQRSNLRTATKSQNGTNRGSQKGSSSKYKGVSWNKKDKRWRANIRGSDGDKFLGSFVKETDAAIAYDIAAKKYHGVFAKINGV